MVKFAIQDFLEDRKFKNLSQKTVDGYDLCLKKFNEFLVGKEIVNVEDITTSTVKGYLLELKNKRNNNPTSVNTKLKNLKAFFNYLELEEIISSKQNPTRKIDFIKEEIKIEVFTDNQIRQMLNYYRRLKYRGIRQENLLIVCIHLILLPSLTHSNPIAFKNPCIRGFFI